MKIYRTTVWHFAIFFLFGGGALLLLAYSEKKDLLFSLKAATPLFLILVFSLVLFGPLTYDKIDKDASLTHIVWGIYKKVNIKSITRISQEGTFYVLQNLFKSIFIYYLNEKGQERFLHYSMGLYSEETLAHLFRDLKEINPNIQLDDFCKKLVRKELGAEL